MAILYWRPLGAILGTDLVAPGFVVLAWLGIPVIFGADLLRKRWVVRRQ